MPAVVLTSSAAPLGIAGVDRPITDFEAMAAQYRATVLRPGAAVRPVAALEARIRIDLSQAVRARRARPRAFISLSERVGIPLSLMRPRGPHLIVGHLLTSSQKRAIEQIGGALRRADTVAVFAEPQRRYLIDELGLDPSRAHFVSDKVDAGFFSPGGQPHDDLIVSVGREQRDFGCLIEAMRGLDARCIILPGSMWSHRSLDSLDVPANVEVQTGLSYPQLRDLYRTATVVAVPVRAATEYAAGINTVLEAMACGRPVVVSQTPGLEGYVADQQDGRSIPAAEPEALRDAIRDLLSDRSTADCLGARGRATVEQERTIGAFVDRIGELIGLDD